MLLCGQVVGDEGPAQLRDDLRLLQRPAEHVAVTIPSADHEGRVVHRTGRILRCHPFQHLQITRHLHSDDGTVKSLAIFTRQGGSCTAIHSSISKLPGTCIQMMEQSNVWRCSRGRAALALPPIPVFSRCQRHLRAFNVVQLGKRVDSVTRCSAAMMELEHGWIDVRS